MPLGQRATVEWVREQVLAAGRALRAAPLTSRDRPQALRCAWPEIVRTRSEVFAAMVDAPEDQRREMVSDRLETRPVASSDDYAALDRLIVWLHWLDKPQQVVVMGRAIGKGKAWIGQLLGISRRTVYNLEAEAFAEIVRRL